MSHDVNTWYGFPINKRHYTMLKRLDETPGLLTSELSRNRGDGIVLRLLRDSDMISGERDSDTINGIKWFITENGKDTLLAMQTLVRRFPGVEI